MKKVFGIKLGGLHQKILNLVLIFMLAMVAVFASVSFYQSRKLAKTVNEANEKQEQSIKQVSGETIQQVVDGTMVKTTALQAYIADHQPIGPAPRHRIVRAGQRRGSAGKNDGAAEG